MSGIVFPKKRAFAWLFNSLDPTFLNNRRVALDAYFKNVVQVNAVTPIPELNSFLNAEEHKFRMKREQAAKEQVM